MNKNRFIVFDRDGTLIHEKDYLSDPDGVELFDEALPALKILKKNGYRFIVITNQSGIARGYYTLDDAKKVNERLKDILFKEDILLEKFYICPHHPEFTGKCNCRKPSTALIDKAITDFDIDIKKSFFIGDKSSDVMCGKNAGMKTALVCTGYGKTEKNKCDPDIYGNDLLEIANNIIKGDL